MARIQALIPDELDQKLREYIMRRWSGHFHGKISEVIREALEKFLESEELGDSVLEEA